MAWNANEKWNYAWFSKQASENGGVKNYIEVIEKNSFEKGKNSVLVKIAVIAPVAITAAFGAGACIKTAYDKHKIKKEKKKELQKQADIAKARLIEEAMPIEDCNLEEMEE